MGKVCNLATVRVNGVDCGTIWTAPYRTNITAALKEGTNELEIEVTNTWANALKGADEGKAPFSGIWTNAKYRRQEKTLLPAGLLGQGAMRHRSIAQPLVSLSTGQLVPFLSFPI